MSAQQAVFLGGPLHGQTKTVNGFANSIRVPFIRGRSLVFTAEPPNGGTPTGYLTADYRLAFPNPVYTAGGGAYLVYNCVNVDD